MREGWFLKENLLRAQRNTSSHTTEDEEIQQVCLVKQEASYWTKYAKCVLVKFRRQSTRWIQWETESSSSRMLAVKGSSNTDWISTGSTEGAEVLYAFASMPQPAQRKLALRLSCLPAWHRKEDSQQQESNKPGSNPFEYIPVDGDYPMVLKGMLVKSVGLLCKI